MNCEQARTAMHQAIDGELDARDQAHLACHTAACAACRHEQAQLHALCAGLDWLASDSEPGPTAGHRRGTWWWINAAAIAAVIALAALWLQEPLRRHDPVVTTAPTLARVTLSAGTTTRYIAVQRAPTTPRVHVVWLYPVEPRDPEPSSMTPPDHHHTTLTRS